VTGIPPTKELSTALKAAAADIDDFLAGTSVEKMMSVKERILAVDPSLAEDAEKDTVACESTPKMPEANWVPGPKGLQ
jgi:hypothetical protein